MRIGERTKGPSYSPDDGDYQGFLNLVKTWAEEAGLPIPASEVARFCQFYASRKEVTLRTRQEWISQLKNFVR
jgi:hypothetical protein